MKRAAPVRRLELAALLGILLLAAFLRLSSPGVVEFKRDEANLSYLALDFARGGSLPLLGISSSVGIPNSPVSVYLFAVPYRFTSDPVVATQFVGLLNVLAVLLTYVLTRRYFGVSAALLAALLYAVSPWGVIYSRKIWAQDLLPPFVLATLLTGLIGFIEGKRWGQWFCLPLLCLTAQIHYSAVLLAAPVAYLVWVGRRQLGREFALSFIPALLIGLPFVVGILQADLPTIDELGAIAAPDSQPHTIGLTVQMLQYAALTIAGTEIHSLAGPQAFQQYLVTVSDAYPMFGLLAWGVLLSALWLSFRFFRHRDSRSPVDALCLSWLIVPIVVFSVTWTEPYPHYLIPIMPTAFIVLAVGAHDLWDALQVRITIRRLLFGVGGVLLAAILALQIVLWLSLVEFLRKTDTPNGFGTPLEYLMPVREQLLSSQPSQVIARLDGQFIGTIDDATVWNFLLYDVPSVRFLDEYTEVFPSEPAILLARDCSERVDERFPLRTLDEGCYQVNETRLEEFSLSEYAAVPAATFSNGVRLLGYRWSAPAQTCFELAWSITAASSEDYMFAVHFFNIEGQEIVNADGLSWRGVYWQPGDTVVRRFCFSPEQAARQSEWVGVNIGMYTFDGVNFRNVDLLGSDGAPIGQIVAVRFDSGAES